MVTDEMLRSEFLTIRNNIRYYRKQLHLTQEDLAEQADLSTSYIKQIESELDFKNISLSALVKLSKALEIPIYQLFQEKNED